MRQGSQAIAETAAVQARSTLRDACSCGETAGITGKCDGCALGAKLSVQPKLSVNTPGDRYEQEADRIADQVVSDRVVSDRVVSDRPVGQTAVLPISPLVQRQSDEEDEEETLQAKLAGPQAVSNRAPAQTSPTQLAARAVASGGQPLSLSARGYFEPRFGRDLSHVRIHTGSEAQSAARGINARAYTLRNHIAFATGEYAPQSSAGRHLLAHELTHTFQQVAKGGSRGGVLQRQPTSLGAIPQNERREIQVSAIPIDIPAAIVTEYFEVNDSGRHGSTRSIGATNSFDPGIDASLHVGLGSMGAWLGGNTNALPLSTSIEVALDLSAHGGAHRVYRFTRFTHVTGQGPSATSTHVMLIEDIGAETATPAQADVPTSVTVGGSTFTLTGTWTAGEYSSLHQALHLLTPAAVTAANGLTFARRSGDAPGGEPAHYDEVNDVVEMFDDSFSTSSLRFGGHSQAVRNLVHEIGHALDLRPLEAEWNRFDAAGQTPAARRRLLQQRSLSGSRFKQDADGEYNREFEATDRTPAFRVAVRADGVEDETATRNTPEGSVATLRRGVTTYSDSDYEELFAESFMLYMADPARLRALRPRTFAFFETRYPRPAP